MRPLLGRGTAKRKESKKKMQFDKKLKSEEFFNPCASVKMGIQAIFNKINFVFASIKFQKIMVQFCYFRLYLGTEIVSWRLLQQMARMNMD